MQQLSEELKNVPTDTSLVCSSTSSVLNRDQSLSEQNKLLTDNNLEVNLQQHTVGQVLPVVVYVLGIDNLPLMPTNPRKARILLKEGKANVVKREPFTIKLNYKTTNFVQDIILGIDSGYSYIGFSAVTLKKEVISGELRLDGKTKERLSEKRMYRKGRRNKLWHREPRFNNRTKPIGWLPPSIQRRYDTHINLINQIKKILPIKNIIIEVGNFDIQKIENPSINGIEYQKGKTAGYFNIRAYIIAREKGKCQLCGKEKGNDTWAIHHSTQRNDDGTDKESNLILLHKSCHEKLHKQEGKIKVANNKVYKQPTFMNIIKNKFQINLNCEVTYGYITSYTRGCLGLQKTHSNDAFCIAKGKSQIRTRTFFVKQRHLNNRSLQICRKGYRLSIRKKRYNIQSGDFFWVGNKKHICTGTSSKGRHVCYGKTKNGEYYKSSQITRTFSRGSLLW